MATEYKIWAKIEELNLETEEYRDLGEPVPIGEFDTVEEAEAFLKGISWDGEGAGAVEDAEAEA